MTQDTESRLTATLLRVEKLRVRFESVQGKYNVINDVDLQVREREIVGIVGESGSGKSTFALSIIRLLPVPPAKVLPDSRILLRNQDLLSLSESEMERIRGTGLSMIFQEPLTCLNPLFTIGNQLGETIRKNLEVEEMQQRSSRHVKKEVTSRALTWMKKVGIPDPERTLEKYPHELSGGMRQRVMIAIALAARPSLMLADEPTSALDVTTQAQILQLIRSLVKELGTSVLFISHDLSVVAHIADRVAVMYAGSIVEDGPVQEIFENPLHPYTKALLASYPTSESKSGQLETIKGTVPSLTNIPAGCPFHPRCIFATEECRKTKPTLREVSPAHKVACVLY